MSSQYRPHFAGPTPTSPRILCQPAGQKALWADGTVVPTDGTAGYEKGCFFQHTDGSAGTVFYINEGTNSSADFNAVLAGTDSGSLSLPMEQWKVWDAMQTNLPGTAAADDLGLTTGTFLTSAPTIVGVDYGGTTTTAYARRQVIIPSDYVPTTNATLVVDASMAVVSDTTAIIDFEVVDQTDAPSVDVCATAQQSCNVVGTNLLTFTLTGTNFSAGSLLDIRMKHTGSDSGNAAPNINLVVASVRFTYTRYL